jgi:hypothetical protein
VAFFGKWLVYKHASLGGNFVRQIHYVNKAIINHPCFDGLYMFMQPIHLWQIWVWLIVALLPLSSIINSCRQQKKSSAEVVLSPTSSPELCEVRD